MTSQFSPYDLVSPGLKNLKPYDPGKPLEELEREYGIVDAIKVASNENPLGPSPRVRELIRNKAGNMHLYPDGAGFALKTALAERHNVGLDQICLGNGSNDVLDMVTRVFVQPGQAGVISQHAFIVYYLSLVYALAEIRIVRAKNYGHDIEEMTKAVDENTAIIYFANPNNPTGTWLREGELRNMLDQVPQSVIVVIDEAYAEYVDEPEYPDCIQWLPQYPNLVVTRTFSKIFGLAGLRIGYSVSSPEINDLMNRLRHPFNANSLGMEAAIVALEDEEYVERCRRMNLEQMQYLQTGFADLGIDTIDSIGNFLCVDLHRPTGSAHEHLLRSGVITRPIGGYEMPNHLRVSIGNEAENARVLESFAQMKESRII